ncbi:metalloregulator ArsR/SmtB family transcription factor [Pseudoalteromonas rubra]|nr:metalloregulator ArsR/SmtB family transcription factor [Pseudoalteromonas rubra]
MKSIFVSGTNPDLVFMVVSLFNHHRQDIKVSAALQAEQGINPEAKAALTAFGLLSNTDCVYGGVTPEDCELIIHISDGVAATHENGPREYVQNWQVTLAESLEPYNPFRKALYELNEKVRDLLTQNLQVSPVTSMTFYKAMSDELRLKTLLLILLEQELCVCELMVALDEPSQPKVSRHLAQLRKAGILTVRKQSQWVYYALNVALPDWMLKVLQSTIFGEPECIAQELNRLAKMGDRPTRQLSCCN